MANGQYEFGDFDGKSPNFQRAMEIQAQINRGGAPAPYPPLSPNQTTSTSTSAGYARSGGDKGIKVMTSRRGLSPGMMALLSLIAFPVVVFGGANIIADAGDSAREEQARRHGAACTSFWNDRLDFINYGGAPAAVQSAEMRDCPQARAHPNLVGQQRQHRP